MPESKHRRKGKLRPRPKDVAGPKKKPRPSPRWVPAVGLGTILLGSLMVLVNYLPGLLESNLILVTGFVLMAVGFGFLAQWR